MKGRKWKKRGKVQEQREGKTSNLPQENLTNFENINSFNLSSYLTENMVCLCYKTNQIKL
jgi:ribosomal protein L35AE/L33A